MNIYLQPRDDDNKHNRTLFWKQSPGSNPRMQHNTSLLIIVTATHQKQDSCSVSSFPHIRDFKLVNWNVNSLWNLEPRSKASRTMLLIIVEVQSMYFLIFKQSYSFRDISCNSTCRIVCLIKGLLKSLQSLLYEIFRISDPCDLIALYL